MQDKTLTCRDCGQAFVFTAGEQAFYAQKGFTNEPTRCPDCRSQRKRSRGDDGYTGGGSYSYGGAGGGSSYSTYSTDRGGYGGGGGYGERRERTFYPATCARCGNETQVPFQPRGDRPVYCSDCFEKQRGGSSSGGGRRDRY